MRAARAWAPMAVMVGMFVAGCAESTADEEATSDSANAVSTRTLHELRCEGTSKTDTSTASVRYTGGDTVHVTVDRQVCTTVLGWPAGCVPQHVSGDLSITRTRITATGVLLVLDNDGTDLDIKVATEDKTGTWFAHENDYTYDLTCDTVDISDRR